MAIPQSTEGSPPAQRWEADRYAEHAHFVPALGQPVLDLLKPLAGERILDLGCGDGVDSTRALPTARGLPSRASLTRPFPMRRCTG